MSHRKVVISLLLLTSILLSLGMVSAQDREAFLTVDVTYFANFNPPGEFGADMSDNVFVGDSRTPFGQGNVKIPLTAFGSPISDPEASNPYFNYTAGSVPGLHVYRGVDENGSFVVFSSYGFNVNESREAILFDTSLTNAVISGYDNQTDYDYFEAPLDGFCGVNQSIPIANYSTNDEYTFSIGGTTGSFCAITNVGRDWVKVYYSYQDTFAPVISDLHSIPALPLTKEPSDTITLSIYFNTTDMPLDVELFLNTKGNTTVDRKNYSVGSFEMIPLLYSIPTNLDEATYTLYMTATDSVGNSVTVPVGNIIVREESDDDDNDDDNDRSVRFIDYGPSVQHASNRSYNPVDYGTTSTKKVEEGNSWLWMLILLAILNVIILVIIIAFASRK